MVNKGLLETRKDELPDRDLEFVAGGSKLEDYLIEKLTFWINTEFIPWIIDQA